MKFALSIIFTCAIFVAQAQSVESIVAKHLEKIGGVKKLKAVNARVQEMTMSIQGQDITMLRYDKRPNKSKVVMKVQGMEFVTNCYDGKEGWKMNQMGGLEKYNDKQNQQNAEDSFDMLWVDYEKNGHTITLAGKEKVGDKECFKLDVTRRNGKKEIYYMGTQDYMIWKVTAKDASGSAVSRVLSDYKSVDGIKMPHKIKGEVGPQVFDIIVKSIKFNTSIDDKIFAYPGDK